jgi:hypothetical protein
MVTRMIEEASHHYVYLCGKQLKLTQDNNLYQVFIRARVAHNNMCRYVQETRDLDYNQRDEYKWFKSEIQREYRSFVLHAQRADTSDKLNKILEKKIGNYKNCRPSPRQNSKTMNL